MGSYTETCEVCGRAFAFYPRKGKNRRTCSTTCRHAAPRQGPKPPPVRGAKWIPLTQGRFTLVDADLFDDLSRFNWNINNSGYAMRGGVRGWELMHRKISGANGSEQVDHVSGDRLDNRRTNLRKTKHQQNCENRHKVGGTSIYKGVYLDAQRHWRAEISHRYLGVFSSEVDAAHAYDTAARELHGAFARLNFPLAGEQSALR